MSRISFDTVFKILLLVLAGLYVLIQYTKAQNGHYQIIEQERRADIVIFDTQTGKIKPYTASP